MFGMKHGNVTVDPEVNLSLVCCFIVMSHRSPSGEWCEIFAIDIHTGLRKLNNGE